jgi:DNA-directed RNA polymerase specialized sigma24 family protein
VAGARRQQLLRTYRHWLRREDLEDCFSQSTFELVRRAHAGDTWRSTSQLASHLDQRFLSRVQDHLRAVNGRSFQQTTLEGSLRMGGGLRDAQRRPAVQGGVEEQVMLRAQLRELPRLAGALSADQRLVLVSQVALQMPCAEFCATHGWSREKYRKVAQRARAKLRRLSEEEAWLEGSLAREMGTRP